MKMQPNASNDCDTEPAAKRRRGLVQSGHSDSSENFIVSPIVDTWNTPSPVTVEDGVSPCTSFQSPAYDPPTPNSTSSGKGNVCDDKVNIPNDLLDAGWRRVRHQSGRPYFYNMQTHEAVWKFEDIGKDYAQRPKDCQKMLFNQCSSGDDDDDVICLGDVVRDAGQSRREILSSVKLAPPAEDHEEISRAQPPSQDFSKTQLPRNKQAFHRTEEYDNEVRSNVRMADREQSELLPPSQTVENKRFEQTKIMFQRLISKTAKWGAIPACTFGCWIMEGSTASNGFEPVLPVSRYCGKKRPSASLRRNLMASYSTTAWSSYKPGNLNTIRSAHVALLDAAERFCQELCQDLNQKKAIGRYCEEDRQWLEGFNMGNQSIDLYEQRFLNFKGKVEKHIIRGVHAMLNEQCERFENGASNLADQLYTIHKTWMSKYGIDLETKPLEVSLCEKKVLCFPRLLRHLTPKLHFGAWQHLSNNYDLEIAAFRQVVPEEVPEYLPIAATCYTKLKQFYKLNCYDDKSICSLHLARLWCLLKRYSILFWHEPKESSRLHVSLPISVFECLKNEFGVTFECFASPLNAYFPQYCSLFADTDGFFGSRGSFFEFFPVAGSMQVFPPWCDEVIEECCSHILHLLNSAAKEQDPLSFVIILPAADALIGNKRKLLEESLFVRLSFLLSKDEHWFRTGLAYLPSSPDIPNIVQPPHDSIVLVVQTDAAFEKWQVTEERRKKLRDSFLVKS